MWNTHSRYLICLSTKDESSLKELIKSAENMNIQYSAFIEPDIGNQITSVTFEPSDDAQKMCSHLPLMLKNSKL